MKTNPALLLIVITFFSLHLDAQKEIIDSAVKDEKTQVTNKIVGNTTDKINQGIDSLFAHPFKRKNKNITADVSIIKIVIDNIDYNALSNFEDALKADPITKNVESSFEGSSGTLMVSYKGAASQLVKDLMKSNDRLAVLKTNQEEIDLKLN